MAQRDRDERLNIEIEFSVDEGAKQYLNADFLIVACDPRNLTDKAHYTPRETGLFDRMVNFTFHTTLLKVKRKTKPDHGVIFAPSRLEEMRGWIYGYRNETGKAFGQNVANEMDENLVTVYQIVKSVENPPSKEKFQQYLNRYIAELDWWPYGTDYEILNQVTTPYFDHFEQKSLHLHLPWEYLKIQGMNHTAFVHASTCFESALHCWLYINLLFDPNGPNGSNRVGLPQDKLSRIVILGAGVSGLLAANKLRDLGYANVKILENTDRYGGKTHTLPKDAPAPPHGSQGTICELGTCYLSPAYEEMVKDLAKFTTDVGNRQIGFGGPGGSFRGIVTEGQFSGRFPVPPVLSYPEYILLKAADETGMPVPTGPNRLKNAKAIQDRLADDLDAYCLEHERIMGQQKPMPLTPPEPFLHTTLATSFLDFLRANNWQSLVGLMQYGYSVQGYGPLGEIPAYYGLIWVTPDVARQIAKEFRHPSDKDIVTAWSLGWGDVWYHMQKGMDITYLAETNFIYRHGAQEN